MSKKILKLLVVAHPDDETIFFGGLLLRNKGQFRVVCVTDGDADGQGEKRAKDFARACHALGVKEFEMLGFPDRFHTRLDLNDLTQKLRKYTNAKTVYTHGPVGEYGHPHHQDVCLATHLAFPNNKSIWSVAHNCMPQKIIQLTRSEFSKKSAILRDIYFQETKRFIPMVPATFSEGYSQFQLAEIKEIHRYLNMGDQLNVQKLKGYKNFVPFLDSYREAIKTRPF